MIASFHAKDSKKRKTTNDIEDRSAYSTMIKINQMENGTKMSYLEDEIDQKNMQIDYVLNRGGKKRHFSKIDEDVFISRIPKPAPGQVFVGNKYPDMISKIPRWDKHNI